MDKQVVFASGMLVLPILILTGCITPLFSPTTYRCNNDFASKPTHNLPENLLPGVKPGMTREQVRSIFQELRRDHPEITTDVTLDDSDPEFSYFLAGACPHLRYRFENKRLVSAETLGMEMGFWSYNVVFDFTKAGCNLTRTETGECHWIRFIPKYDQQGHFIGREGIDDCPVTKFHLESAENQPYCKGMERDGT